MIKWLSKNWFSTFSSFNLIGNLIATASCVAWFWLPEAGYIVIGWLCWLAFVGIALVVPYKLHKRGFRVPLWTQWLAYGSFCFQLREANRSISYDALIDYRISTPFSKFLEIEMPKLFKEGGMNACEEGVKKWIEDYQIAENERLREQTQRFENLHNAILDWQPTPNRSFNDPKNYDPKKEERIREVTKEIERRAWENRNNQ